MEIYKFKYRRRWWLPWRTIKVTGHDFSPADPKNPEPNKMFLALPNGGHTQIANWAPHCERKLGADYFVMQSERLKRESGGVAQVNQPPEGK